jgi:hypothetical protein
MGRVGNFAGRFGQDLEGALDKLIEMGCFERQAGFICLEHFDQRAAQSAGAPGPDRIDR